MKYILMILAPLSILLGGCMEQQCNTSSVVMEAKICYGEYNRDEVVKSSLQASLMKLVASKAKPSFNRPASTRSGLYGYMNIKIPGLISTIHDFSAEVVLHNENGKEHIKKYSNNAFRKHIFLAERRNSAPESQKAFIAPAENNATYVDLYFFFENFPQADLQKIRSIKISYHFATWSDIGQFADNKTNNKRKSYYYTCNGSATASAPRQNLATDVTHLHLAKLSRYLYDFYGDENTHFAIQ